jgi:phage terminase large subunit-like protein
MEEFPQSPERMVPACGRLFELIVGTTLAHDDDPDLRAHVTSAVRRDAERGWTLSKGRSSGPIDACVAAAMAVQTLARREEPDVEPFAAWS